MNGDEVPQEEGEVDDGGEMGKETSKVSSVSVEDSSELQETNENPSENPSSENLSSENPSDPTKMNDETVARITTTVVSEEDIDKIMPENA